jgi:hypothetical protein
MQKENASTPIPNPDKTPHNHPAIHTRHLLYLPLITQTPSKHSATTASNILNP